MKKVILFLALFMPLQTAFADGPARSMRLFMAPCSDEGGLQGYLTRSNFNLLDSNVFEHTQFMRISPNGVPFDITVGEQTPPAASFTRTVPPSQYGNIVHGNIVTLTNNEYETLGIEVPPHPRLCVCAYTRTEAEHKEHINNPEEGHVHDWKSTNPKAMANGGEIGCVGDCEEI